MNINPTFFLKCVEHGIIFWTIRPTTFRDSFSTTAPSTPTT